MHKLAKEMGKWALEKAKACGFDNVSSQDWDDLKDCMEVVKAAICADKEYREVEDMDEYGDMEKFERMLSMGNERMGYRGRDSRGRFVHRPGRGRSAGYTPYMYMMDDMYDDEYDFPEMMGYRMGYSGGRGGNSGGGSRGGNFSGGRGGQGGNSGGQGGGSGRSGYDGGYGYDGEYEGGEQYGYSRGGRSGSGSQEGRGEGSRYGRSYDNYRSNRRHYTDSKDPESKKKMEESMKEYTEDVMSNMKEMWKDADPQLRQTMKADLTKMVQQLQ